MNGHANGQANGHADAAKAAQYPSKQANTDKAIEQKDFLQYTPNPHSEEYEFLGPPGALMISVLVTVFTYFFALGCNERGCPPTPLARFFQDGIAALSTRQWWANLWDTQAFFVYLGWYAWTVICWAVLPGKWIPGGKLRNGEVLQYKINCLNTFYATAVLGVLLAYQMGAAPFIFVYDHWTGLVTSAFVMAFIQATYCYAMSFVPGTMLAVGGNTGNMLYDWFIGRTLNPRIGIFDIKTFNELRPGMILWFWLNVCMAVKQYEKLGRITDSMALVQIFQLLYIFDSNYMEPSILTQMDITTDGFGYMLAVGDLVWVPFTYGLQARYLALHPKDLGWFWSAAIVALNATGYYIFRISNEEKNVFRLGSNPKNLKYMKTERGTNLLISGWWGRSRHPNYLGDWIMSWAWCLPCGIDTPVPYYYMIYFAILLLHRQNRDDEACRKKYGKDWDKYCKIVKYKIIPGLY